MRILLAPLAALLVSCTASLDLDRFRAEEAPVQSAAPINVNYFDVRFTTKNMQPHLGEFVEVRLVDRANAVQAKAIYNDVTGPDFSLYLARVVPKANAPYRLDFWADHNASGSYDGIVGGVNEKDHAWRRVLSDPLPDDMRVVGSRFELEFIHDTAFVDIGTDLEGNPVAGGDTLLPCDITVAAGEWVGKMVELRVVDRASGRLVGLYRQGRATESFHAKITGILDEETTYDVAAFVDLDGSGTYEATDPSWKFSFTSTAEGGNVSFDATAGTVEPIETGEP